MGKSKAKGPKAKSVFHVAKTKSLKARNKAKPVTTSLKKINIVNDEKVRMINKAFTEVQKEVKQLSKSISSKLEERHRVSTHLEVEPVNVDAAASLLSQL
ncbi:ribosomal biogenesis factor [Pelodiscus sinensis]|uniref:ribosomal biogenesis factor n=1 Tax=Pelodiscus sinensis TaxID=13735 RepID=UPI003F6BE6EF